MVDKSISLRRKVRPEGTTLHADESLPIKENRSFFVHFLLFAHDCSKSYKEAYYCPGVNEVPSFLSQSLCRGK